VKLRNGTDVVAVSQRSPRPNFSMLEYQELIPNRGPTAKSELHNHLRAAVLYCDIKEVLEPSKARRLQDGEHIPPYPYWTEYIDTDGKVVAVCNSIFPTNPLMMYYREATI
jgi:hypothetical protein